MTNFREVLFWSIFLFGQSKDSVAKFCREAFASLEPDAYDKCKKGSDDARLLFHSVHRITSPDARTHIFLVRKTSAHFQCGHTTLAQGEMSRTSSTLFHTHLPP